MVVCSQPLPGPRAGPGPDKGKGWRGTETAAIQLLRAKSGAKAAVREPKGKKPDRRSQRRRAASGAWPRAVRRAGPGGGRQPHASRPAARLFVLPQRACNAGPPAGAFKEATKPVPTRLQPGDPAEQFRGSLTLVCSIPARTGSGTNEEFTFTALLSTRGKEE